MKLIALSVFLILTLSITSQENKMNTLESKLSELKQKYAPDKRTAIFEYEIDDNNLKVKSDKKLALDELTEFIKINSNLSLDLTTQLLPSSDLKDKIFGIVNISVANLRTSPKHSAELATQSLLGDPVKVLEEKDYWFRIQTSDNYIAWVDDDGFHPMNKNEFDEWIKTTKIIYTNDYGFSYEEKSNQSNRVSDLVIGNLLKFIDEDESFYQVEYPDGRIAYVNKNEAKLFDDWKNQLEPNNQNIVKTSMNFMGMPYLWGGTSAKGIDCSGFTKTVYRLNGIILQRDASQQVNTGVLVETPNKDFSKLTQGDLLFFGDHAKDDKKERITHVGIYIGGGEFIHSSGKVKINSLDPKADNFSKFRYNQFIRAKRILNSIDTYGITTFNSNKFYNGDLYDSE